MNLLQTRFFYRFFSEGTTLEALKRVAFKKMLDLIDIAGVRRQAGVESSEGYVKNSLAAVRNSHLVILMINVNEPYLTSQDLKLTDYVFKEGASIVVLFNKVDLLDDQKREELERSLDKYKFIFRKLETLNISCKDEKNIGKILPLVYKV